MAKDKAAKAKPVKETKEEAPKAKAEAPAKEKAPEFKYGVDDIATKLNIKPTSVRVKLRNHEVPKAGRSYGWNSKDELNAVITKISAKSEKAEAESDESEDEEDDE